MPQCKAIRHNGERCKRKCVIGKAVCATHGGRTPTGVGSPRFKTGKYSKYLPDRLIGQYEEAQSDPQLLGLRDEIALVDTRLGELISKVDTKESGLAWKKLRTTLMEFKRAQALNKVDDAMDALYSLEALINAGGNDYLVWSEIGNTINLRRSLVESERRHLVEMQQMVSGERIMVLLAAIVDIIRRNVQDRESLARISDDIRRLISPRSSGQSDSRPETALVIQGISREV